VQIVDAFKMEIVKSETDLTAAIVEIQEVIFVIDAIRHLFLVIKVEGRSVNRR
jgi:hypothetical protein